MRLEILHVPDCPNVTVLRERLNEALGDTIVDVTVRAAAQAWATTHPKVSGEIVDNAEADTLGRTIFGDLLK